MLAAPATVLVVDDDPLFQALLEGFLAGRGNVRVEVASQGAEAITLIRAVEGEIALIVLDLNMPDLNGIELLTELQAAQCRAPLIIVTGAMAPVVASASILAHAYGLEVAAVMGKPVAFEELGRHVDRILAGRAQVAA